jgi:serine-type D-Ala-D-Ala carboxypeptidase (penicillin-binding protein 5/6)
MRLGRPPAAAACSATAVGAAIAALTALAALAVPTAALAVPAAAGRAATDVGPGATAGTSATASSSATAGASATAGHSATAGSGTLASNSTHSVAVPRLGSRAASVVGGPLMASRGIVVQQPAQHARPLPKVPASAWVIANANTGQVLAARDPHGEFGPASTLKVLTAVTLIPRLNPNALVVASKLAASQEPNIAGLIPGRAYKVSDLFNALLLISANDAAVALTEATGSFAKGMAMINAEARHLQAYDVDAKLPNGLPAAGQVVSAYDEALIARQALAIPAFMRYDETLASRFEVRPHHWETLVNQNSLLTSYRGGIGGKIGWTVSSEATYIGLARRHGVTLIATVLHCTPLQEITTAERLLTWGFAMNGKVRPVGTLVPPLATAAAVRHAASRPKEVALSSARPGPVGATTGYALAATGVVAAGLGLGSLARTRRRPLASRRRPHLGPALVRSRRQHFTAALTGSRRPCSGGWRTASATA